MALTELERQRRAYGDAVIRRDALAAVAKSGLKAAPILSAHLIHAATVRFDGRRVEVDYSLDGLVYDAEGWLAAVRNQAEFAPLFLDTSAGTATPAKPPPSRNPWRRGTPDFNLTDQMKIAKADPALAARLKSAAHPEEL